MFERLGIDMTRTLRYMGFANRGNAAWVDRSAIPHDRVCSDSGVAKML
jgi:hypothetical protein